MNEVNVNVMYAVEMYARDNYMTSVFLPTCPQKLPSLPLFCPQNVLSPIDEEATVCIRWVTYITYL